MKNKDSLPPEWDEQRVEQLILFSNATPDQKLQWLDEVFVVFEQYLPRRDVEEGRKGN